MNICHDFTQVAIGTTAGGMAVLSTANGTRVPTLNRLLVGSTAATRVRIQSVTTATTSDLVGNSTGAKPGWPLTANELHLEMPMEPLVEACIRGLAGGSLQVGSTSVAIYGVAIVGWTTEPAT
jgi:hypothetical protein